MGNEALSALIVIAAFAPIALQHFAPDSIRHPGRYHALAVAQILTSIGLFVILPPQVFFMYWCILPALFGAWHFWRALKPRPPVPVPPRAQPLPGK
ncbi:MAG: hypothetical protein IT562_17495 [Alphaproteobacteria bacterium]|nr:hypothetical protein [Alphaproteobacteria bacterium]